MNRTMKSWPSCVRVERLAATKNHRTDPPAGWARGGAWPVRPTRLGGRFYTDDVEYRIDPRGREYLWLGGPGVEHRPVPGSDTEAYDEGVIGLTPLVLDLFARDAATHAETVADGLAR